MKDIYIPSESEKEIEKNPLVFLKKEEYENSNKETIFYWKVIYENINTTYKVDEFGSEYTGRKRLLARIYKQINKKSRPDDKETYSYKIDIINKPRIDDLNIIFRSALENDLNVLNAKFNYCYLLWCLNHCDIDKEIFTEAIESYPNKEKIKSIIKEISPCLSSSKQNLVVSIINNYIIYNPESLKEALSIICPNIKNLQNLTIYNKFDMIFSNSSSKQQNHVIVNNINSNEIVNIYDWLQNDEYQINNYHIIVKWFSFVSHKIRLLIIKKYFHDIRNNLTNYDENIIEQFEKNKYSKFQIFRHCLESPKEAYPLSTELLCNSIRIFIKSKGEKFQDINNILDIAVQKCDIVQPNIDFRLEEILPICNGGAIFNENFSGFIEIENEYLLKQETLERKNIKRHANILMNKILAKYEEYLCNDEILGKEQAKKCQKVFNGKATCLKKHECNDKWEIRPDNKEEINLLSLFIDDINISLSRNYIEEKQINYDKLITVITDITKKYGIKNRTGYCFRDMNGPIKEVIDEFYEICSYKIYPNENAAIVSNELNIKRINSLEGININLTIDKLSEQKKWLSSVILNSLEKELCSKPIDGKYFEVNTEDMNKLSHIYYYNPYSKNNDFLTCRNNSKYYNMCAPKCSENIHKILNINYFWCKGKECFKNNLSYQLLDKCNNFKDYTLFHITEILGYKLINIMPAGNEPEKIARNYVAQLMKAIKKFNRLRCKNCGHLLFPNNEGSYNQHFYYCCKNKECTECDKLVYLNYCYRCKKGLIDSRETAKCENSWYICPSCLSCCDDNLIDRLIQRDITAGRAPRWLKMKGKGHNNKSIYFCPDCGTQLSNINDNDFHCNICNKKWRKNTEKNMLEIINS